MRTAIYALVDPRAPDAIRYVGKARDPQARLRKHRRLPAADRKTHRGHWIAALQAAGIQPELIVLVRVPSRHEDAAERAMIRRMRTAGHPLTNGSDGGEGGRLRPDIQTRATAKIKALVAAGAIKPPRMTPTQQAARDARLSALQSDPAHNPMKRPEVAAKNAASQRARAAAMGRVAYVPATKRGTPEWLAMQRAKGRAAKDPDVRAKISASLQGRPKADDHRRALAAAFAAKSGFTLRGQPTTLLAAAKALGVCRKTIRNRARICGGNVQAAIDAMAGAQGLR